MGKLVVKGDELEEAGNDLAVVAEEFSNASDNAHDMREHVGYEPLADKVDDFALDWSSRRGEMLEVLNGLAETAKGITDAFRQVDEKLAEGLGEQNQGG